MLNHRLSERLRRLRWILPIAIGSLTAVYQICLAIFIQKQHGNAVHYGLEIFLYSTISPIILWFVLGIVYKWIQQKEMAEAEVYRLNTDLQQKVEERTSELIVKAEALAAANERLQEVDRLKSEFVSLVSHELRAPLTNIYGAFELMGKCCPAPNEMCDKMFGMVKEQTGRLTHLVDNVLNISRIESSGLGLTFTAVDIVHIADRAVIDISTSQTGHIFSWCNDAIHPVVWADADRLYQVISNLLDNATKYSPPHSEVHLKVYSEDSLGVISVSDCGLGIPAAERELIFKKFYRLDRGDDRQTYGFGLGLFLCRCLVEAMNGHIWVEGETGRGATFLCSLPLAEVYERSNLGDR